MFAFDSCKFHIRRCKESTGRVVMWKEMSVKNSFTLEVSLAGTSLGYVSDAVGSRHARHSPSSRNSPSHFAVDDLERFGRCICHSFEQYFAILSDAP
jgi:hypothetical protein